MDLSAAASAKTFKSGVKTLFFQPSLVQGRSLPEGFLPELVVTTCELYFDSRAAIELVAREWAGWDVSANEEAPNAAKVAPLRYLPEEGRFELRWSRNRGQTPSSVPRPEAGDEPLRRAAPREGDDISMDALTALSVLVTDAGTLLNGVASKLSQPEAPQGYTTVAVWLEAARDLIESSYGRPKDALDNGVELKERMLDVLREHAAWQQLSDDGPFVPPVLPGRNYWWFGAWLLSASAQASHEEETEEDAGEIIALFAIAKHALRRPGRRRVKAPRVGSSENGPAFKSTLRDLRCEKAEFEGLRKLAWRQPSFDRESLRLRGCMAKALEDPFIARHLADDAVSRWLHKNLGLPQAVGYHTTDVPHERPHPTTGEAGTDSLQADLRWDEPLVPSPGLPVTPAVAPGEHLRPMFFMRPSRPAALMWSAAAAQWHGRGQAAADHVLGRIRRSRPPTREQAEAHLHARLMAANEVSGLMGGYLRHAFWFAFSTLLLAMGAGGACSLLASGSRAIPSWRATEHLAALVPLLGVALANISWARARGLPAGLTVWGWTLCGASAVPALATGREIWATAAELPLGCLFIVALRLPVRRRDGIGKSFRPKVTASKLLNLRLEQREAPLSTDLETVPLPAALALPPEVFVRLYPDLDDLATEVRNAEYDAYARYGRYAPILAYTRLARQPMAHYFLVHRGDEGVRIRGFAPGGAYK